MCLQLLRYAEGCVAVHAEASDPPAAAQQAAQASRRRPTRLQLETHGSSSPHGELCILAALSNKTPTISIVIGRAHGASLKRLHDQSFECSRQHGLMAECFAYKKTCRARLEQYVRLQV